MTSVRLAVSNAIPMLIHEKCFYTEILKSDQVAIGRVLIIYASTAVNLQGI